MTMLIGSLGSSLNSCDTIVASFKCLGPEVQCLGLGLGSHCQFVMVLELAVMVLALI